jgi:FkbM family methyltransferase
MSPASEYQRHARRTSGSKRLRRSRSIGRVSATLRPRVSVTVSMDCVAFVGGAVLAMGGSRLLLLFVPAFALGVSRNEGNNSKRSTESCGLDRVPDLRQARATLKAFYTGTHSRKGRLKLFSRPNEIPNGSIVIDVGSNVGNDLVRFVRNGAPASVDVHTYEPIASIREKLEANVASLPTVHVHPFGLSDVDRKACFAVLGRTVASSATREQPVQTTTGAPTNCSSGAEAKLRESASVITDIAPARRISLLHMNCEGCEFSVLRALRRSPTALGLIDAIEMQVHAQNKMFSPEETVRQYCSMATHLQRAGFKLIYRFPFLWELWQRPFTQT